MKALCYTRNHLNANPNPLQPGIPLCPHWPMQFLIPDSARNWFYRGVTPLADQLGAWGVHPNHLTVCGVVLSGCAGLAYGSGQLLFGGVLLALGGLCDALDGLVARRMGTEERWGAFLDSTLDRIGESVVMLGLAFHYMQRTQFGFAMVWMVALATSLWVSYVKARAEGLGVECHVGWMQRPERLLVIITASWLTFFPGLTASALPVAGLLIAALSTITCLQRMRQVWRSLNKKS